MNGQTFPEINGTERVMVCKHEESMPEFEKLRQKLPSTPTEQITFFDSTTRLRKKMNN